MAAPNNGAASSSSGSWSAYTSPMEKLNQRVADEARHYGAAATFGAIVGAAVTAGIACGIAAWAAGGRKLQPPPPTPPPPVVMNGMTQGERELLRASVEAVEALQTRVASLESRLRNEGVGSGSKTEVDL